MSALQINHRKGLLLCFSGGLLLSFDVPLLRLADTDAWTAMAYRGALVFVAIIAYWLFMQLRRIPAPPLVNGWAGFCVSLIYGLGSVLFMLAVHRTTTANLVFILAFTPMFAAVFSWLFLREKINTATLLAFLVAFGGISIIVYDGFGRGSVSGDIMALATAICMAAALTLTRWSGRDLSLSPALGQLLSAGFAVMVAAPAAVSSFHIGWLALNGLLVVPLALSLLALGPHYLPAPEVAMFFLLESVLAPLWVWLILFEHTSTASIVGGAIVITAIMAHSLWQLKYGSNATTGKQSRVEEWL